jgi:hypothetical protein
MTTEEVEALVKAGVPVGCENDPTYAHGIAGRLIATALKGQTRDALRAATLLGALDVRLLPDDPLPTLDSDARAAQRAFLRSLPDDKLEQISDIVDDHVRRMRNGHVEPEAEEAEVVEP